MNEDEVERLKNQIARLNMNYKYACNWLLLGSEGGVLPYFRERGFRTFAVYGIADFGEALYREIRKEPDMQVVCFVDKKAETNRIFCGLPVYLPTEIDLVPEVDAMIVTAIVAFDRMKDELVAARPELPIISLQTVIDARILDRWN